MLVLSSADLRNLITMQEAINAVSVALCEYSNQRAITPVRTSLSVEKANATSLFMPAYVEAADSLGMKFVSVFPDNKQRGKKTIYGVMVLADADTGEPLALMDASELTVLRTGAAAGLATKWLARPNATILSIIGTGAQARGAAAAVMAVRDIEEIRLYNRTPANAHQFAQELINQFGKNRPQVYVVSDADSAIIHSDVVVTATNSNTPVFAAEAAEPGVHVNAIGSFRPAMQEVPSLLLARADKVVVESREAALEETGDLLIPIQQGVFQPQQIYAELGEIAAGGNPGREREDEITLFKSVGLAVMDAVVAKVLYDRAVQLGVGQHVSIS